jgi:phenylacetate-CoA ligase
MNWRRPLIHGLFRITGRRVPEILAELRAAERLPAAELQRLADEKLARLLRHAHATVPYYRPLLEETGVIRQGRIDLEAFTRIPPLTRDTLWRERDRLHSQRHESRHSFVNSTGGSTGEPVRFLQDREHEDWSVACKFHFREYHGIGIGDPEIKLWGSAFGILDGREDFASQLKYRLFNIEVLNSFRMSDDTMRSFVKAWKRQRPDFVWSYPSSLTELGHFLRKTGLRLPPPRAIVCTAEPFTEELREFLQETFACPVWNQYGSREAGPMAAECPQGDGLHVFVLHCRLEILDENLRPCEPGQLGNIHVTTLNNASMPLIRYQIGDTAFPASSAPCACGRSSPRIAVIAGRKSDHFRTAEGNLIHGGFFNQLIQGTRAVRKFRVIQRAVDHIDVYLVPDGTLAEALTVDLTEKFRAVMGAGCRVDFHLEEDIPPLPSGKHRHTISEVP